MFYIRDKQTINFKQALAWSKQGLVVLIHGSVTCRKAGREKVFVQKYDNPLLLEKIIPLFNDNWKITTSERHKPESLRSYSYSRLHQNSGKTKIEARKTLSTILPKESVIELIPPKRKGKFKKEFVFVSHNLTPLLSLQEEFKKQNKPYQIIELFHGTKIQNIQPILKEGLHPSQCGMLGRGIYLAKKDKAKNYSDLLVLKCQVLLGLCKELENVEDLGDPGNEKYDSLHLGSGRHSRVYKGYLSNEEWVVRNPKQLVVVGLFKGRR